MVHEVNGFTDPSLVAELREGTGRRSPRSIVADAIRHTAARAVSSRQSRPDEISSFGLDAESLAPPGIDSAVPDLAALLGGLGAPTAIQSLTVRAALPGGRPGAPEPDDLGALRASRVAALEQELRATLALISGYSQSLAHLTLDESSRRRYLDELPIAAAHLAGVTSEILEICVPQEETPVPRPVALRRISP